ncbi:MAG TPA: OBAP family protein [Gammaproteobacteria bacterium]
MTKRAWGAVVAALLAACGDTGPSTTPSGQSESLRTQLLELGAALMQESTPLAPMDIYLVGFHPLKDDPTRQLEAHHYCSQVNEDFAQCVLFDGNTRGANMNGVEYIISARLYETLPEEEKQYWHPHNYEILSGQLVAPRLPQKAELALMRSKLGTYGKTWHFWNTGHYGTTGDALPLGAPRLAWSFNRDGEALPGLVEERDVRMDVDTGKKRRAREALAAEAQPQAGVDALRGRFGRETVDLPGVRDVAAPEEPVAPEGDLPPADSNAPH